MHSEAISETRVEGVAPLRGYRMVYFCELDEVCRRVPEQLAGELREAAAEYEARPSVKRNGGYCFKFWPAPSQAGMLGAALAAVRA